MDVKGLKFVLKNRELEKILIIRKMQILELRCRLIDYLNDADLWLASKTAASLDWLHEFRQFERLAVDSVEHIANISVS